MGRPRGYNREEVLDRAMDLFWKMGYEGAHLAELVEVTGLNRFSLYKEFGGKAGLFQEALKKYFNWLSSVTDILGREPLGLNNIHDYLDALVTTRFKYGCFIVNSLTERDLLETSTFTIVKEFVRSAEEILEKNLNAAQASGDLSKDKDTRYLAKFIVTFDIGIVTYDILKPKSAEKMAIRSFLDLILK